MVRLVRFERTLHALSTHSLCRLGYRRLEEVEDQVGFKPTRGRARPLKRRLPSIAWLLVRDWRTSMVEKLGLWRTPILEDTVGLAPTLRRWCASRVKSPVRSLLRSRVRNGVCLHCRWWPLFYPRMKRALNWWEQGDLNPRLPD
jgi:hypothetical protein